MIDTAIRSTGIGASEAAAAIGADPYKAPYPLWAEKTGKLDAPDLSDMERVDWGHRLQPIVADVFAERTGRAIRHNRADKTRRHPEVPFMLATLDCTQRSDRFPGIGALEIKTTSVYAGEDWKDEPPLRVQVQLQHQLAVTGYEWGTIACLIGGQRLVWYDQPRHPRFIDALIQQEREFWKLVETETPPPVDGSTATAEAIKALYRYDNGVEIVLPDEAAEWDRKLAEIKEQIKAAEEEKRAIENQIKAALGQAVYGVIPGGNGRFKWGTIERNEPAREARTITYRQLRKVK